MEVSQNSNKFTYLLLLFTYLYQTKIYCKQSVWETYLTREFISARKSWWPFLLYKCCNTVTVSNGTQNIVCNRIETRSLHSEVQAFAVQNSKLSTTQIAMTEMIWLLSLILLSIIFHSTPDCSTTAGPKFVTRAMGTANLCRVKDYVL